jgi:hypothetical protein
VSYKTSKKRPYPSGASAFVLGAPTNGNVKRNTENGKTLKEVESENSSKK